MPNRSASRIARRIRARRRTVLPPVLSIRNGRRSVVITGTPEQLSRFELYCEQIAESGSCRAQEQRCAAVPYSVRSSNRFRSRSVSTPASGRRRRHRRPLGRSDRARRELAREMAEAILVRQVDRLRKSHPLHGAGARWILDLGPGDILTRLTAPVVRGLGVGIVPAATRGASETCSVGRPRSRQAVVELCPDRGQPAGRFGEAVDKFTRLTGRSPILLAA